MGLRCEVREMDTFSCEERVVERLTVARYVP